MVLGDQGFADDDGENTQGVAPSHLPNLETEDSVIFVFADNPHAIQFELVDTLTVGRRSEKGDPPDLDLAPYGAYPAGVSRRHLRLTRTEEGKIYLEDLGARNGTFRSNGEIIPPGIPIELKSGYGIRIGMLKLWIYFQSHHSDDD